MASVSKHRDKYIIRVKTDEGYRKISGFKNKREAERVRDKISALEVAKMTGDLPRDVAVWASDTAKKSPELYKRLASFGLVDPPEETHTLEELIQAHRESRRDVTVATLETYEKIETNLCEFFGESCELDAITRKRADDFAVWLRTASLNRRRKGEAVAYSTATINRRVGMTKQLFHYARKVGWMAENPFEFIKGGESVNPELWEYVDAETIMKVLEGTHLAKWRAIIAMGRFAGVRGSSELFGLLWEHVHWSSEGEGGHLIIQAEKNKRHGRQFRSVPMHPVVEHELSRLFEQAAEGEPHVFPGMKKQTNFSTMTQKLISAAGLPLWPEPWKNLRKSFCCDLMQIITDPAVYEKITDHSLTVAMKHYQIPHAKRLQAGFEKVLRAWGVAGVSVDSAGDMQCSATSGDNLQQESHAPYFADFTQEKEKPCENSQGLELGVTGFEPVTSTV